MWKLSGDELFYWHWCVPEVMAEKGSIVSALIL